MEANFQSLMNEITKNADRLKDNLSGIPKTVSQTNDIPFKDYTYRTQVFFIAEEVTAQEYADFITKTLHEPDKYMIVREKENWTQNAECIRIVDYLEKIQD